ncbi:glutelin type-B 5-like [Typha angustifolia]|uniref:glutelin type-B 5-like n=1 Tax=Typha angustifolia TaxID=59011 RepID=UPI003C2BDD34
MNILSGFDVQMLAEALGVSNEMVRKLQGQNDQRGEIVRVRRGLHMMRPARMQESQPQQNDENPEGEEEQPESNGLDETFCNMKTRANINDPSLADVYNPHAGRITNLNSQKLSILNIVQMSANRVVLYRNATLTPYWNINAHSLMYVTSREAGRVQIVDNRGRTAFDGELYQGQVLIIPQHYAVVKRAERGRFSWVSFNTNSNSMVSQMAGKASIFRGMPVDVLTNAYHLSREEARMLKFNRGNEMSIFASRFGRRSSSE